MIPIIIQNAVYIILRIKIYSRIIPPYLHLIMQVRPSTCRIRSTARITRLPDQISRLNHITVLYKKVLQMKIHYSYRLPGNLTGNVNPISRIKLTIFS